MGPCHHSMARSQMAGGGTDYNIEGNREYIE